MSPRGPTHKKGPDCIHDLYFCGLTIIKYKKFNSIDDARSLDYIQNEISKSLIGKALLGLIIR